jgi:hypothetical protein
MIAIDLYRHSRGDRHVKLNADGTVARRMAHDKQGRGNDSNFLPVPRENFYLLLRRYGGDSEIQAGRFPCTSRGEGRTRGVYLKCIVE